ncbi:MULTISPECIES: type IV secretory system conjugative DNA transfer family protein [Acidiphilium]|uniref:Defect in organelle trafficking protein DotC n=1 Tax=Acidiphilium rubrum TaxID=526 RepID=A0A8G2CMQ4_ACIRU|nr:MULTISPECIES: type IV secretory system conjugative DNA transfer family protein [Acidiphilium]SIR29171.1 defect in organelle trafficking protein DotC [Acidiphilium rubrum]
MNRLRLVILAATLPAALFLAPVARAAQAPFPEVGISDNPATIARSLRDNANPLNNPVAGARINGILTGGQAPPSLNELQALRPLAAKHKSISPMRRAALKQNALSYGAQGGLAAESYAINLMLVNYQADLDRTFDFGKLMVDVSNGQTLLRPPIVTEAQMAFALAPGGQVAKQTDRVYEITQQAQLASAPPNWRTYLVRTWAKPVPPPRSIRPRSRLEVAYWHKWVAEGWALGEAQGAQIFLDDLSRLQNNYIGMVRYQVLLRAGLVESPDLVFHHQAVSGGRNRMLIGNDVIRITNQPGLDPNAAHWHPTDVPSGGPIGQPPVR